MKKLLATVTSVVFMASLSASVSSAQTSCPPEVAQAKSMIEQRQARTQDVNAPRSLAGARTQDVNAPRTQDVNAPRVQEVQAPRSLAGARTQDVNAPRTQDVADAILQLIELPSGKRPLRTVCGMDFGANDLNGRIAPVQADVLRALGMEQMIPALATHHAGKYSV